MFKKKSANSLQISSRKACFVYNGEELPGITLEATVKAIFLGYDQGNKEAKIKPGEKLKIEIEGQDENGPTSANFYLSLNNFVSKKFLCCLENCQSPYLTIIVKAGEKDEIPTIFTGYRNEQNSSSTNWAKQKYSFDDSGDIFDKQSKEVTTAAGILEAWATLFNIPFIDTREADKKAK
jgi:hypothetical protein